MTQFQSNSLKIRKDTPRYHRWSTAASGWCPRTAGYPMAVHSHCNNQQWRVIGGLNAYTGQVTYRQNYIGREQVILFHQQLQEQYRKTDNLFMK